MIATVSVLMAAHLAEVLVWSVAYAIVRVAPAGTDLVYFAFVNYTTLGYGDVTPLLSWQLLGPMTAMNGVLMFAWSTLPFASRRTMISVKKARAAAMHWTRDECAAPQSPCVAEDGFEPDWSVHSVLASRKVRVSSPRSSWSTLDARSCPF
jgi:hypothetical protein